MLHQFISSVRTTEIPYSILCIIRDVTSCVSPSRRKLSFWISPPSGTQEQENMPNSLKYVTYPCYVMCFLLHNSVFFMTKQTCRSSDCCSLLYLSICVNLPCKQQRSAETITSTTVNSCSDHRITSATDIPH